MTTMRALLCCAFGFAAAQTTQSGCTCKSYSEVRWRSPSGSMEGGFSHSGCGVGPFEDYGPGKGRNWCDTVQTNCNNGQGWDLCIRSSAPLMPPARAEPVNVNQAWSTASIQTSTKGPGVNLNVNVNVGGSSGSTTVTTLRGCTCHPTSEVIVLQNGVRVGGGFSHTGCGTGPFEANSPGKGSPWCDTVETWCSDGWDLCVPPNSPQQNSYTPLPSKSQNSVSSNSYTSYSNTGTYQQFFPPSPSYQSKSQPSYQQPRYTSQPQQPSAYIVQPPKSSRSPFNPPKNSRQVSKSSRSSSRGGNFDYDYDAPSSNSNLLPLMLLSGSSSSTTNNNLLPFMLATQTSGSNSNNNNLLPLMLASQGSSSTNNMLPLMLASQGSGSSSNMLPMMMMMGSGGLSSSNPMAQYAMLSAFREGDGQVDELGEAGKSLGFTRAVVVTPSADSAETDDDASTQSPDLTGVE